MCFCKMNFKWKKIFVVLYIFYSCQGETLHIVDGNVTIKHTFNLELVYRLDWPAGNRMNSKVLPIFSWVLLAFAAISNPYATGKLRWLIACNRRLLLLISFAYLTSYWTNMKCSVRTKMVMMVVCFQRLNEILM